MYDLADIRQLHIEPSTRCNAECPMCCRNARGRTSPGLAEQSMTAELFGAAIPEALIRQLEVLDVCGAYGDPAMAPDLITIIEGVRRLNPSCEIVVFSNGGLRDQRWWSRLGSVPGAVMVVFAIDGVDTNSVYRRRVDIAKVLTNASAFIESGGRAQWDYLVFEHNEHEIELARQMSHDLGFERFAIKRTARFLRPLSDPTPEVEDPENIESFPIYDRDGQITGYLRPPRATEYVNDMILAMRQVKNKVAYLEDFFNGCHIKCSAVDSRSIFLSVAGHVYPCCWTYVQATLPEIFAGVAEADTQVSALLTRYGGESALDATRQPVGQIIRGGFFQAIERSWSRPSVSDGKLKVCARVCGEGFNAYRKQFESSDLVP